MRGKDWREAREMGNKRVFLGSFPCLAVGERLEKG